MLVLIGLLIAFLLLLILLAILWPKAMRTVGFIAVVGVVLFVFAVMDQAPT